MAMKFSSNSGRAKLRRSQNLTDPITFTCERKKEKTMKTIKIAAFSLFLVIAAAGGVLSGKTQGDIGLTEHIQTLEYLETTIQ
jgi:hypothetical protein